MNNPEPCWDGVHHAPGDSRRAVVCAVIHPPADTYVAIAKPNIKWPTWYTFRNLLNEIHGVGYSMSWI